MKHSKRHKLNKFFYNRSTKTESVSARTVTEDKKVVASRNTIKVQIKRHPPSTYRKPSNKVDKHIQVFLPFAKSVYIESSKNKMSHQLRSGWFTLRCRRGCRVEDLPKHYRLYWEDESSKQHNEIDPYTFECQISDFDLYMFKEGRHLFPYKFLGANHWQADGFEGILFAVWAPNAEHVSVIGDFNMWHSERHPMLRRGDSGIWEVFVPEIRSGERYKFEIKNRFSGKIFQKIDPYGKELELEPITASVIPADSNFRWKDQYWLNNRHKWKWQHAPISIYEIQADSWKRNSDGSFLNFRDLAKELIPYVKDLGFSHIELQPLTEHSTKQSWGNESLGYFTLSRRYGNADDLRFFVDYCHQNGIGVIIDWAASHFPDDLGGLVRYDGEPLYENSKRAKADHPDRGTPVFDYGRSEVKNYLIGNAMYWFDEFHIDGLGVGAVASMLYFNYSRTEQKCSPNNHNHNHNLEAMCFIQTLNHAIHHYFPDTLTIAEESTCWPLITSKEYLGGLGFSMKRNMGWTDDTLSNSSKRSSLYSLAHDRLSFEMLDAFKERFCFGLSLIEVANENASLLEKMPGGEWEQRANLRLFFSYIFSFPGKKLLYMGAELGQRTKWRRDRALDWQLMDDPKHRGIHDLVRDLNLLYKKFPALHEKDFDPDGFQWIDCTNKQQSTLSYCRYSNDEHIIVVLNLTSKPRYGYQLGAPNRGVYNEIFNSGAGQYGGSNPGSLGRVISLPEPYKEFKNSILLTLPPLTAIFLCPQSHV